MTENELQQSIIDYARMNGWRIFHAQTSRVQRKDGSVYYATAGIADSKGWPDLFMVKGRDRLAVEVKSDKGKPSTEQNEWLLALFEAGIDARVWRPRDWPAIERRLGRRVDIEKALG